MAVRAIVAFAAALIASGNSDGAMAFLTQSRSISVTTTFNGAADSASAPDFSPFLETLALQTSFPTAGGTAINRAVAGIDCHLDPNKIRLSGRLAAAGGLSLVDGQQNEEVGDALVLVTVTFHIDADSPFLLAASARPDADPKDKFKIKLSGPGGGDVVFFLDEKGPAQAVQFGGVLAAGDYKVEYEAELSSAGADAESLYAFSLDVPAPAGAALMGGLVLCTARRRRW